MLIGCFPVDGDTYDIPAEIAVTDLRWKLYGMTPQKFGHREKFGNDPAKHRDFSAVYHVEKGKGIPPFLILHITGNPDTTAQAFRLGAVLKEASKRHASFPLKFSEPRAGFRAITRRAFHDDRAEPGVDR